jgi:hypothetical protein
MTRGSIRIVAPAAALLLLGALAPPAGGAKARVPAARSLTVINGLSGTQVAINIDRTVQLNNAGLDTPVRVTEGRWGGVLIAPLGASPSRLGRAWYVHYRFTDELLCPGERCPMSPATYLASGGIINESGGTYTHDLPPGRYTVILLGDPGAHVTAKLRFTELAVGTTRTRTTSKADLRSGWKESVGADGHHVVNRDYLKDDLPGPRFDAMGTSFVLKTPAVANSRWCFTEYGEPGPTPTSAACAGGGGPPGYPVVLTETEGTAYGFDYALGMSPSGYFAHGWDAEAAAAESRISVLHWTVFF